MGGKVICKLQVNAEQERLQGDPNCMAFLERAGGRHSRMAAAHGKRQGVKGAEDRRFRTGTRCV